MQQKMAENEANRKQQEQFDNETPDTIPDICPLINDVRGSTAHCASNYLE
mgnify:CR=1 FL=1